MNSILHLFPWFLKWFDWRFCPFFSLAY